MPEAFTAEHKARNFAYYERITVCDSSLSAAKQAVLAAETGHLNLAYDYLSGLPQMSGTRSWRVSVLIWENAG